jgi:hypothetical protein
LLKASYHDPQSSLKDVERHQGGERAAMFTSETVRFLQSGCGLIVGTVDAGGMPLASRGWGLDVDAETMSARLLLAADDAVLRQSLASTAPIAVTGASVRTLRSVQLKGSVGDVGPATDRDRARSCRYCDDFFGDIVAVDHIERAVTERLRPADLIVCRFAVDEVFDQTPGPAAGARLAWTTS